MKEVNSYDYILIGLYIRHLRHTERMSVATCIDDINGLLKILEEAAFNVSIAGSTNLGKLLKKCKKLRKKEMLPSKLIDSLEKIMSNFEHTIFAEASTKSLFYVTEKKYNTAYLLNKPHKLFADKVFVKLPNLSFFDFTEGFRCIAFGMGTAAAFHILRATEGVLKELYLKKIKTKKLDKKHRMWGPMLDQLRKKKTNKLPKALIDNLDNIRENYRNPTQHPDATYTIDSAQDLLGLCVDVVNKMAQEMAD